MHDPPGWYAVKFGDRELRVDLAWECSKCSLSWYDDAKTCTRCGASRVAERPPAEATRVEWLKQEDDNE